VYCTGSLTRLEDGLAWGHPYTSFQKYDGFVSAGDNIIEDDMGLEEAKERCREIPECMGFTYSLDELVDGKPHIYFKKKWDIWPAKKDSPDPWVSYRREETKLECTDIFVFMIFGILALFVAVLLTPMLATHLPLATRNITTIEDNYENMPNPFDQGTVAANLAQVFGAYGPDWPFPVYPWRPLSDGISFARSDERLGPDGLPERAQDDNEMDTERLWRVRYHARSPVRPVIEAEHVDTSPLSSLARWWNG